VIDHSGIRARLMSVRARIHAAADRSGRDPAAIRLIAVSKTFSIDHVRAAFDAGQQEFGENKVQEALRKMDESGSLPIRWHLVGHLQSNKAKKAGRFDTIQSVDSADLLRSVDAAAEAAGRRVDLLVQVDLAREPAKHGAAEVDLAGIFEAGRQARASRIVGLMLLPPFVDDPNLARPFFRELRDVRQRLLDQGVDAARLAELSMGMSHDFEVAIEEGATIVRVGTAIFGIRPKPAT